jgi:TM2 domain-containing membrane protein YozV
LAFPIFGGLEIHKFYLGKISQGIMYFIFSLLLIPAIISLFEFTSYLSMSTEKFDEKFNAEYSYYNKFKKPN